MYYIYAFIDALNTSLDIFVTFMISQFLY